MQRTFFTRLDALQRVGQKVEALADFPSVPKGSRGIVMKAEPYSGNHWVVKVEWRLPRRTSVVDAMVWDVSLNFYKKSKPVTDNFANPSTRHW